jgi:hypothetical protein
LIRNIRRGVPPGDYEEIEKGDYFLVLMKTDERG